VVQDLDDRFKTFVRGRDGVEYPFRSRLLPPREFFHQAQADLDRFAVAKALALTAEEQACRICGCTNGRACLSDETGEPCHWVEEDLCSECECECGGKEDPHAKAQRREGGKP
jgi:hypothetical protein